MIGWVLSGFSAGSQKVNIFQKDWQESFPKELEKKCRKNAEKINTKKAGSQWVLGPHWLWRCHNLPQPARTHHNVLWWDVVRCGELWRAYHNLPQKLAPSCGELWHPQLEPTICHNSPQSIHILPQLNHILPQLNHTLPHLTTIHPWFITFRIHLINSISVSISILLIANDVQLL